MELSREIWYIRPVAFLVNDWKGSRCRFQTMWMKQYQVVMERLKPFDLQKIMRSNE